MKTLPQGTKQNSKIPTGLQVQKNASMKSHLPPSPSSLALVMTAIHLEYALRHVYLHLTVLNCGHTAILYADGKRMHAYKKMSLTVLNGLNNESFQAQNPWKFMEKRRMPLPTPFFTLPL